MSRGGCSSSSHNGMDRYAGIDPKLKFVIVAGGVISGIGKGLTSSSLGVLLKACGWRVSAIKIDPYINVDAGTMSPFEHGETFVLNDGGETDLDLGNYERFLSVNLTRRHNITTGKVYSEVIERERRGDYLGRTVQVVPHLTDLIQDQIMAAAVEPVDDSALAPEVVIIELGGTVGDIESAPFVEALRQLRYRHGQENVCIAFVSLVPCLGVVGEQKTKPTQAGCSTIASLGLPPQLIFCRSDRPLLPETRSKIALFAQVPVEAVVSLHDVSNTFRIPLMMQEQGVTNALISALRLSWRLPILLERWGRMAAAFDTYRGECTIAIVGKYTGLADTYLSVIKALEHAGMALHRKVHIRWIAAENLEGLEWASADGKVLPNGSPTQCHLAYQNAWRDLASANGILVPGGFGSRGVEGMLAAIRYAREQRIPYLGICLGMQLAAVELARARLTGGENANSSEFDERADPAVVIFMPEVDKTKMGGTMRLGVRKTVFKSTTTHSIALSLYGRKPSIMERHRHRYEVNPDYVESLEKECGLHFVARDESGQRMEIAELDQSEHPFFLGTQFHPELKSRPGAPSPPFLGFVAAAAGLPLEETAIEQMMLRVQSQDPWQPSLEENQDLYSSLGNSFDR
jgi:CTP synthase